MNVIGETNDNNTKQRFGEDRIVATKRTSRAYRCEEACGQINGAVERLREIASNLTDKIDDMDKVKLSEINSQEVETELSSLQSTIESAFSVITDLKDELENWRDGLTGTNLENSNKYAMLDDACSILDTTETDYTFPDVPNSTDKGEWESFISDLESLADEIENNASEAENVEFPTMYS